jgi:hypothetical protein
MVCIFFLSGNREPNGKEGPLSRGTFHLNFPMVLVNDAMGDGETETNPSFFCGEERVEEFIYIFAGDTYSRVLDGDMDPLTIF